MANVEVSEGIDSKLIKQVFGYIPLHMLPMVNYTSFDPIEGFSRQTPKTGILLLRHSKPDTHSSLPEGKIFAGAKEIDGRGQLTEEGRRLARTAAITMFDWGFRPDIAFSSVLLRASGTAHEIASECGLPSVIEDPKLSVERDFGKLNNLRRSILSQEDAFNINHPYRVKLMRNYGVEGIQDFMERTAQMYVFMSHIYKITASVIPNPQIVLVSHGGTIDMIDRINALATHHIPKPEWCAGFYDDFLKMRKSGTPLPNPYKAFPLTTPPRVSRANRLKNLEIPAVSMGYCQGIVLTPEMLEYAPSAVMQYYKSEINLTDLQRFAKCVATNRMARNKGDMISGISNAITLICNQIAAGRF